MKTATQRNSVAGHTSQDCVIARICNFPNMHRYIAHSLVIGVSLAWAGCARDTEVSSKTSVTAPKPTWHTDAAAALAAARTSGKLVLMDFTGSDWCPPCEILETEVLSGDGFARLAAEKFVLLKLDFPQHTELGEKLQEQNNTLAERYEINAFPTALVTDADGTELGRTEGYMPGQPDAWLEQVSAFAEK